MRAGEGTGTAAANPPPAVQLKKQITFSGLTAELFEDVEDESAPSQPDESNADLFMSLGASQLGFPSPPGGDRASPVGSGASPGGERVSSGSGRGPAWGERPPLGFEGGFPRGARVSGEVRRSDVASSVASVGRDDGR